MSCAELTAQYAPTLLHLAEQLDYLKRQDQIHEHLAAIEALQK